MEAATPPRELRSHSRVKALEEEHELLLAEMFRLELQLMKTREAIRWHNPEMAWSLQHAIWDVVHPGMNGRVLGEIVFIRHAESKSNKSLTDGEGVGENHDSVLTELGRAQADVVQGVVHKWVDADPHNTLVYVSPLARALETIGDIKHTVWANLIEFGRREDMEQFKVRCGRVLAKLRERILESKVRRRIIVVGHSKMIEKMIHMLMGASGSSFIHLANASVTIAAITTAGTEFTAMGCTRHLDKCEVTGAHTPLLLCNPGLL